MSAVESVGSMTTNITNGTAQVKTGPCAFGALVITAVGVGATVDIYDHTSATTNRRAAWVTADGKGIFAFRCRMRFGIRQVVTLGGAEGYIVWGD